MDWFLASVKVEAVVGGGRICRCCGAGRGAIIPALKKCLRLVSVGNVCAYCWWPVLVGNPRGPAAKPAGATVARAKLAGGPVKGVC